MLFAKRIGTGCWLSANGTVFSHIFPLIDTKNTNTKPELKKERANVRKYHILLKKCDKNFRFSI
jgi:hypothetical protein